MKPVQPTKKGPVFECKCCGHCCHGKATVSVSAREQGAIADFLGLSLEDLVSRYLNPKKECTEMKIRDGHCIFYGNDGLCMIHPVKPFHCRRWPLHPSILQDEAAWKAIRRDCAGFREDASYEQVCALVEERLHGSE